MDKYGDNLNGEIIENLLNNLEKFDKATYDHCLRVAEYSRIIAEKLNLPEETIRDIEIGATLHDIGKLNIPHEILHCKRGLTNKERKIVQTHTEWGYRLVRKHFNDTICNCVRSHHEKLSGKGYPRGLTDHEIPIEARIVAVADVFDAIKEARSYSDEKSYAQAMLKVFKMAEEKELDLSLVTILNGAFLYSIWREYEIAEKIYEVSHDQLFDEDLELI